MSNIATLPTSSVVDTRYTQDVIPILDTSKFEHMQRIAMAMAETSMVPESLRKVGDADLPQRAVIANCFRVVNQAVRWGFDPFAVLDCAYIVHGKLGWEGKLVAAVIDAKIGVTLNYTFDDKQGQELGVTVSGTLPGESQPRTITGRVKDWHKGPKSPWAQEGAWRRQLRYMGAREWARAHKPAVMLGIYADDELYEMASLDVPAGQRARRMKDITPPEPTAALELPDIPDAPAIEADEPPADDTAEARNHIAQAVSIDMLQYLRTHYAEADWEALAHDYDAKLEALQAVQG